LPASTQKQVPLRTVFITALIVVLAASWFVWTRMEGTHETSGHEEAAATATEEGAASTALDAQGGAAAEARSSWAALLGREPSWPDDFASPRDCAAVEADLARICSVIDSRHAEAASAVPGGSCGLLQAAARELTARPPVTTAELKSYQTMLANVFHVFRVLGRERLELLRQLAREQSALSEPAAMAFYRWLISREACARSGETTIRLNALYDYASFLFQTMGGQAYLRRRTPESEALIAFYALMIVDAAERGGHNPNGVDPRPEIRRTRALIASSELLFAERYAAALDRMARGWEGRGVE